MSDDYFTGPERIAVFEPTQKKMRMGAPGELDVSDCDRFQEALDNNDFSKAAEYLDLLEVANTGMLALLYQWAGHFHHSLEAHVKKETYQALIEEIYEHFKVSISNLAHDDGTKNALSILIRLFSPNNMNATITRELAENLANNRKSNFDEIIDHVNSLRQAVRSKTGKSDLYASKNSFESYYRTVRAVHDSIVQYTDSFPTIVAKRIGQELAERTVDESFKMAPFHTPLWQLAGSLNPKQLAAFLLEHLRDHFSGTKREGSAKIIEHEDRFQLIFEPCGSGGALRRRLGENQYKLEKASPATFSREGQVPAYCTHCAFNAIYSIEKFGYPIYVTEFNPDPLKPCGWTVYKDPSFIPDQRFEELGHKKNPGKFKRDYWKKT